MKNTLAYWKVEDGDNEINIARSANEKHARLSDNSLKGH